MSKNFCKERYERFLSDLIRLFHIHKIFRLEATTCWCAEQLDGTKNPTTFRTTGKWWDHFNFSKIFLLSFPNLNLIPKEDKQ